MKSKIKERQAAVELRKKGYSYKEIEEVVPVSRASLSLWLRKINLTKQQKDRLATLSLVGQQAGAKARRTQRLSKLSRLTEEVKQELPDLLKNNFFTLGLALYWAEGSKQKPWNLAEAVGFANSDPMAVLVVRRWMRIFLGINEQELTYRLHIHVSANVQKAIDEWSDLLGVENGKIKFTLKHNSSKFRHNKFAKYRGLISMRVRKSTWLNRKIELWVQGAAEHFLQE